MINRDRINKRDVSILCKYFNSCRLYNETSRLCNEIGGGMIPFEGLTNEVCPNYLLMYRKEMTRQFEDYERRGD